MFYNMKPKKIAKPLGISMNQDVKHLIDRLNSVKKEQGWSNAVMYEEMQAAGLDCSPSTLANWLAYRVESIYPRNQKQIRDFLTTYTGTTPCWLSLH
jgi:2-iminoacetate synthase ThiH